MFLKHHDAHHRCKRATNEVTRPAKELPPSQCRPCAHCAVEQVLHLLGGHAGEPMGCGGSHEATSDIEVSVDERKTRTRRASFSSVSTFFSEAGVPRSLKPLEVLIQQGEVATSLFLIKDGQLDRIRKDSEAQSDATLTAGAHSKGELLGAAGFLLGAAEAVEIRAAADTGVELLEVSQARAIELVNQNASLSVSVCG